MRFTSYFINNRTIARLALAILILEFMTGTCISVEPPNLLFEMSQLTPAGGSSSIQVKKAEIMVPENPEDPGGRLIPLRIVVVPAKHRNKAPDPLFILAGGPGQAITEAFPSIAQGFTDIQEERDLILVDQRGSGGSYPLECLSDNEIELSDEEIGKRLRHCLENLDADLRFYATEYYLRDLEYVRELMGFEQINLYGASYGTRVAQKYHQRYPQRVRSMILDAVAPPEYLIFYDFQQTVPRSFNKLFERCESDLDCSTAFPNLREEFFMVLARLEKEPVPTQVTDPKTGKTLEFLMTRDRFLRFIMPLLYAPETVALVPLTVHTVYEYGDFSALAGQSETNDMGIYTGLMFSVVCVEDVPLFPTEEQRAHIGDIDFSSNTRLICEVCRQWDVKENNNISKTPETSNIPVLLLSGDADPVTPPQMAEQAMKYFPNSLHISVPDLGHGLITRGCIGHIVGMFIRDGFSKELDTSCAQDILPVPFFISSNGPTP